MLDNITVFSRQIACYNLFINAGTLIGLIVFLWGGYKKSYGIDRLVCAGVLAFALLKWGFFASNLLRGLNQGDISNVRNIFTVNTGGHFLGRVIFAVWFFPVLYRLLFQKKKGEWVGYMDALCMYLVVQHIFNRIACLLNGCCEGKEYDGLFSFRYSMGRGYGAGFDYSMYPTQLFEIVSMTLLLIVCIYLCRKNVRLFFIFEIWFGITIFISEFMMENEGAIYYGGLDAVQYGSLILIITAFVTRKIRRKSV